MKTAGKYSPNQGPRRALATLFVLLLPFLAHAEAQRFLVLQDGLERRIESDSETLRSIEYVSLSQLVSELGGALNIQPSRIRIDLGNATAYIKADNNRVNALSLFSLKHPIREKDGTYWISLEDLSSFFLKSFRLEIQHEESTLPEMNETGVPGDPFASLPELESPDPQESAGTLPHTRSSPFDSRFQTILIDPGHGGGDSGVPSSAGYTEKELTLGIALKVREALPGSVRQRVILTREDDHTLSNQDRARMAQNVKEGLVISLHAAYEPSSQWAGFGIYRQPASSAPASQTNGEAANGLSASLAEALRKAFPEKPLNEARLPLQLFSLSQRPGILVEVGFLSNAEEAEQLAGDKYRTRLAEAIAQGLLSFLRGAEQVQPGQPTSLESPLAPAVENVP